MTGFVLRVAIVALGLWLATQILPGLAFDRPLTLLVSALDNAYTNTPGALTSKPIAAGATRPEV